MKIASGNTHRPGISKTLKNGEIRQTKAILRKTKEKTRRKCSHCGIY